MTGLGIGHSDERPASLDGLFGSALAGREGAPLVEIVTADEQRARTSQAYSRSAVGDRLRCTGIETVVKDGHVRTVVTQIDSRTGLSATTELIEPEGLNVVRALTTVRNDGSQPVVVTAVTSLTMGFGRSEEHVQSLTLATARSEWLAENRWQVQPLGDLLPRLNLALHGQDGRGHAGLTSHGAWSSGEHLPVGVIVDSDSGASFAWQIDSSGPWHVDLSQTQRGGILSLLGPTDLEHGFAQRLEPGDELQSIPVAIAVSDDGQDGAIAELTGYRRWLRGGGAAQGLPFIYNDFMNTLMGEPTTEALEPLIAAAAETGVEVFCIDAGWFADPSTGDWWSSVGEWREARTRFTDGLASVIDSIHRQGMRSGLWLEPEVVGVDSPTARSLPEEAFFHRFGRRVVEDRRYHLDFRHPAARDHLDRTIDHLIADYGISYLKLDYNINPGAGTDVAASSAAEGLVGHTRAYRTWLDSLNERHPDLLIENCASGAMRADYGILAATHLQSTSDQQDHLLYPPIAAAAPAHILPEQCGNWAYPAAAMSDDETVLTLVTGLSGRFYLSGFLHDLRDGQRELVNEAAALYRSLRPALATSVPVWPLGMPAWNDPIVCLVLRSTRRDIVAFWQRGDAPASVRLPGVIGRLSTVFPRKDSAWTTVSEPDGLTVNAPGGPGARLYVVEHP